MVEFTRRIDGPVRILVTQGVVVAIGIVLCTLFGIVHAYSAALGGIACLLPNAYSIWRVFGVKRSRSKIQTGEFYRMLKAEFAKFVLTGFLFVLFFMSISPIEPVAMFTVFTVATFSGWIEAGLRMNRFEKGKVN